MIKGGIIMNFISNPMEASYNPITAADVAIYYISKDRELKYFKRGRYYGISAGPIEGNVKLNRLLHITQNIYLAKTGYALFGDTFKAYEDGPVIDFISRNYSMLVAKARDEDTSAYFDSDIRGFLDQVFDIFKYASIEDLCALSREDSAWEKAVEKPKSIIRTLDFIEDYKIQYFSIIEIIAERQVALADA